MRIYLVFIAHEYVSWMIAKQFAQGNMKTLPEQDLPEDGVSREFKRECLRWNIRGYCVFLGAKMGRGQSFDDIRSMKSRDWDFDINEYYQKGLEERLVYYPYSH